MGEVMGIKSFLQISNCDESTSLSLVLHNTVLHVTITLIKTKLTYSSSFTKLEVNSSILYTELNTYQCNILIMILYLMISS